MGLRYNPFTGSFDLTRSPGSYLDGEVATYGDLPLDTAAAPLNSAWLVRGASGLWLLSRKPAGIYIRTATTGVRDDDYTYAGTFPDVFSDANFVVYNDADSTKNVKLDASALTTGTTRTLTVPDKSGVVATTSDLPDDYTVVATAGNLANGDRVAANTTSAAFTLTLPASPANGDTIHVLDYAGTFASNNLTIARNGNNIESLAEDLVCNVEKAAFSLVYAGSTVGWKVVPQTAQMPSTSLANTWQVNQTFEGTNNTAPNQTASSGSSLLTRDLGDARFNKKIYYAVASANTDKTSDTTYQTVLTFSDVEVGDYVIDLIARVFPFAGNGGAKIQIVGGTATISGGIGFAVNNANANAYVNDITASLGYNWGSFTAGLRRNGRVAVTGAGTILVQFAQNTADANATRFTLGSYATLTPVS